MSVTIVEPEPRTFTKSTNELSSGGRGSISSAASLSPNLLTPAIGSATSLDRTTGTPSKVRLNPREQKVIRDKYARSGFISSAESASRFLSSITSFNMTEAELEAQLKAAGWTPGRTVPLEVLLELADRCKADLRRINESTEALAAFVTLGGAADGSGTVSTTQLKEAMSHFALTDQLAGAIPTDANGDKKTELTFSEFAGIFECITLVYSGAMSCFQGIGAGTPREVDVRGCSPLTNVARRHSQSISEQFTDDSDSSFFVEDDTPPGASLPLQPPNGGAAIGQQQPLPVIGVSGETAAGQPKEGLGLPTFGETIPNDLQPLGPSAVFSRTIRQHFGGRTGSRLHGSRDEGRSSKERRNMAEVVAARGRQKIAELRASRPALESVLAGTLDISLTIMSPTGELSPHLKPKPKQRDIVPTMVDREKRKMDKIIGEMRESIEAEVQRRLQEGKKHCIQRVPKLLPNGETERVVLFHPKRKHKSLIERQSEPAAGNDEDNFIRAIAAEAFRTQSEVERNRSIQKRNAAIWHRRKQAQAPPSIFAREKPLQIRPKEDLGKTLHLRVLCDYSDPQEITVVAKTTEDVIAACSDAVGILPRHHFVSDVWYASTDGAYQPVTNVDDLPSGQLITVRALVFVPPTATKQEGTPTVSGALGFPKLAARRPASATH
jgi:hypothetical protein